MIPTWMIKEIERPRREREKRERPRTQIELPKHTYDREPQPRPLVPSGPIVVELSARSEPYRCVP